MSDKELTLKDLKSAISPYENPLISSGTITLKKKRSKSELNGKTLYDCDTGEVAAVSVIHSIEEKDDEHFVKVFADGVKAAFELSRGAAKVFQAILTIYQNQKMTGGYADSIHLYWFGDGLNGELIGMSERTFNRGLKELLEKKFLAPKIPNIYWVNPTLFFKGNRVALIREYRRIENKKEVEEPKKQLNDN